ncbi:helix-turn-helix domain-containing protein [Dyadobacter sp. CY323]|uniref:helix-turn-helix domain-containing protein n=1 Tax=Dyadobacter sp. CY323 TaxID=2907302 RepID=UPI001F4523EB|nr:helix-turn-helix domain-containing protein [Dyadobacter sp. CY323]MCE6992010.1 helix-turn-helix domain-containing protein [Dyadobacter sp. CY323]
MDQIGRHVEVTGPLEEVIKHFYCIHTPADFPTLGQHLSPSLEVMLIFNFGPALKVSFGDQEYGKIAIDRIGLTGPLRKRLNYEVLANTDLIAIVFNPNGFYRLFQIPADEMQDDLVYDPDKLLNITGFGELWEILNGMQALDDRIALLLEYGNIYFQDVDDQTVPLLAGINQHQGTFAQPSKAIAIDTDLSERTIQMRFKKYLGFSTKELSRFLRFKQVIDFIQKQEKEVDWLLIVDQFGYYDQSHLIKDFKYYLATTPRKFVQDFLGKEFCVSRPGKDHTYLPHSQ